MIPAIRSEARKLLTVRSTYVLVAISLGMILLFAGYGEGIKASKELLANPGYLLSEVVNAVSFVGVFCALLGVLLFSHEYRYNLIMHTLTSTNSRSKVLLAKIVVMTVFAAVFAVIMGILSPIIAQLGASLAGKEMVDQAIPVADVAWRVIFYTWGLTMFGMLFVAITRNQAFAIVTLFFTPIAEGIATNFLKADSIYLPLTALGNVIQQSTTFGVSHGKSAIIFLVYLISSWAIAWYLFLRRDAN